MSTITDMGGKKAAGMETNPKAVREKNAKKKSLGSTITDMGAKDAVGVGEGK